MTFHDLDTPALLVDLKALQGNIERAAAAALAARKRLRPHTKTHKCLQIARMQVDGGARGLTVAKLGEAEVFADGGFDDLFVANELVGAAKIERLGALARRVRVSVGVDSLECAEGLTRASQIAGAPLPVRIEVDTGHHRAGVRSVAEAVALAQRISEIPALALTGVFTHEGHVYAANSEDLPRICSEAAAMLAEAGEAIAPFCRSAPEVSVGSTPGFAEMAGQPGVTELRPGVYVFNDAMQCGFGAPDERCAMTVLATVVSRPDERTALLDAGTKALSGDRGPDACRHGRVLEYPEARFDWASEEHGHLDLSGSAARPRIGEKVRIVPWHACATTNMHDNLFAVQDETVVDVWPVAARGRIR